MIAVVIAVILFALIPLVIQLLGIPQGAIIVRIIEILIGGLLLLYIITGDKWIS
jgi:hypothetical protein